MNGFVVGVWIRIEIRLVPFRGVWLVDPSSQAWLPKRMILRIWPTCFRHRSRRPYVVRSGDKFHEPQAAASAPAASADYLHIDRAAWDRLPPRRLIDDVRRIEARDRALTILMVVFRQQPNIKAGDVIPCGDCMQMPDPPILKLGYDNEKQPVARCDDETDVAVDDRHVSRSGTS